MVGWIKLHRNIKRWNWSRNPDTVALFVHILITANYEESEWMGINLKPGQLICGINALAAETGLTPQKVRGNMQKLISCKTITKKSTNKFTILTIENWEQYQGRDSEDNKQTTNKQQTNNKQITTDKEDKKERKKEYKYPDKSGQSNFFDSPPDFKKAIWDQGLKLLGGEKNRSLMSKLVRDYGETQVITALVTTQSKSPVDPKAYFIQILKSQSKIHGEQDDEYNRWIV